MLWWEGQSESQSELNRQYFYVPLGGPSATSESPQTHANYFASTCLRWGRAGRQVVKQGKGSNMRLCCRDPPPLASSPLLPSPFPTLECLWTSVVISGFSPLPTIWQQPPRITGAHSMPVDQKHMMASWLSHLFAFLFSRNICPQNICFKIYFCQRHCYP